jgi:hypothetical protein
MHANRLVVLSAAGLALVGFSAAPATAQFMSRPPMMMGGFSPVPSGTFWSATGVTTWYNSWQTYRVTVGNTTVSWTTTGWPAYNYNALMRSYGGYAPFNTYAPGSYDPYGGYVRGGVGGGYGQQQGDGANGTDYGARRRDTKQGVFDEWVGGRDRPQKPDDRGQQVSREMLEHALSDPSEAEIISGTALNTIVAALQPMQEKAKDLPALPIDEDTLRQINFARGANNSGGASFGLLGQGGQLVWPKSLLNLPPADETAALRRDVEKRLATALDQARAGKMDAENLRELTGASRQLSELVSQNVSKMSFDEHREAKRFLRALDDSAAFLQQPDLGNWLVGKNGLPAKSVQELVRFMGEKGMRFVRGLPGSEKAYFALYRSLVEYYNRATAQLAVGQGK